jgi:hypothetical protein
MDLNNRKSKIEHPKSIDLHIEELVLYGFDPLDRRRIAEALPVELSRLLAERGLPPSLAGGVGKERIDGGMFEMKSGTDAETIAREIAAALYGGLHR